jgi:hypothetical protein
MDKKRLGIAPLTGGTYTKPAPKYDILPKASTSTYNGSFRLGGTVSWYLILGFTFIGPTVVAIFTTIVYYLVIRRDKALTLETEVSVEYQNPF